MQICGKILQGCITYKGLTKFLSPLELKIMYALWGHGALISRQITEITGCHRQAFQGFWIGWSRMDT